MPEKPLNPDDGSLAQFAEGLRQLRRRADNMSYRQLAERAGVSASALSQAASGRKLPTWHVTQAFVKACGGDEELWYRQWSQLRRELNARQANTPNGQVLRGAATGRAAHDARGDAAGDARRRSVLIRVALWVGAVAGALLLGAVTVIVIYGPEETDQSPAAQSPAAMLPSIPTYLHGDLQGVAGLYETPRPSLQEVANPPYTVGPTAELNIVCQVSNGTLMKAVFVNYAGAQREQESDIWYHIAPQDLYIPAIYTTYPDGVENKLPPGAPYGTEIPECRNVPP
jgi:transcriptional regulator with XRE-family HTH domain